MNRGLLFALTTLLAMFVGTARAECYIIPLHTIIFEGDSTVLTVQCNESSDPVFDSIEWKENGGPLAGMPTPVVISTPTTSRQYTYRTPATLVEGSYVYAMTGTKGATTIESGNAQVLVRGGLKQTLTVNRSPGVGGTITQMTTGAPIINCGATCIASPARNSTLTLVATPNVDYDFAGWSGDCAGTGTCTLTMSANRTVTATFIAKPIVASCGAANAQVYHQTAFDGLGDGELCTGASASSKVSTATAHRWSCGASRCQAARGYNVASSIGPQSDGTMTPTGTHLVQAGRTKRYAIAANPTSGVSMSGTCGGNLSGTTAYTTNAITQDCTVIANFPPPVTVTAAISGQSPGVVTTPQGSVSPATRSVAPGTTTTFTVTPVAPYSATVSGTCPVGSYNTTTKIYTTGVIEAACTVSATFTNTAPSYTVTYSISGTSVGTLSTSGGSISKSSQLVTQGGAGSVLITVASGYNASASGCSGSPTSNYAGPTSYTFTTGSIMANCPVTVNFAPQGTSPSTDPGIGSNKLWIPPTAIADPLSNSNLVVADHSGPPTHPIVSYIPGCINGGTAATASQGCAVNTSYTAIPQNLSQPYEVKFAAGKTLSLRYLPNTTFTKSSPVIKLESSDGQNGLPVPMYLWITTDPTVPYESTSVAAACKKYSQSNATIYIGGTGCQVDRAATSTATTPIYYVNIKAGADCSSCNFQLNTNNSDFQ